MSGIFNHIWNGMQNVSEYHENACHEFALKHNCIRESYHGKTFEGNECGKLMTKIDSDEGLYLANIPEFEHHIQSIKEFNTLRKKAFGAQLKPGWKISLEKFDISYRKIPNITKPLKVHIILAHLSEFIEQYGENKGLGLFSEQTGEAVHQNFDIFFAKYCIKTIYADQYGQHLHKAVVEFSSSHI